MAPARSIQCMRRPPRSEFSGLASFGSTSSVISEIDSRTGRGQVNVALSSSTIRLLDENSALTGAKCLQIAVCEPEDARVRMRIQPGPARQVQYQFPMFDRDRKSVV